MEIFSAIIGWVSAGAIASLVTLAVNGSWERRKLIRAERMRVYADYLAADSERWRAFGDRDGAKKRQDQEGIAEADAIVLKARERMWAAYCHAQVAGSDGVVKEMLRCIRISDERQRAYAGRAKSPANPERMGAIRALVTASRKDLRLRGLPESTFERSG